MTEKAQWEQQNHHIPHPTSTPFLLPQPFPPCLNVRYLINNSQTTLFFFFFKLQAQEFLFIIQKLISMSSFQQWYFWWGNSRNGKERIGPYFGLSLSMPSWVFCYLENTEKGEVAILQSVSCRATSLLIFCSILSV